VSPTLLAQVQSPQNLPRDSDTVPKEMQGIGIQEKLGSSLPMDLTFTNETGQKVRLGDFFLSGKPVVLTLAYYECPMLCTLVLNGVTEAVSKLTWVPGQQFELLTISINPKETAALAAQKRQAYLDHLGKKVPPGAWHFLVGEENQISALAQAVGFKYYYDEKIKQYAHPAASYVITPKGVISRYLYGITYRPADVKLALLEASAGKLGTTLDRIVLSCYAYDPNARGYVLVAVNVMRIAGAVAVVSLALLLGWFWYRERHKKQNLLTQEPATGNRHG
jgi:protein SCO1/2